MLAPILLFLMRVVLHLCINAAHLNCVFHLEWKHLLTSARTMCGIVKHVKTGEEREVGQSWTGGLAQGCAPVFQPFGEPGEMCGRDLSINTCDVIVTFNNSSHPQYSRALCQIDVSLQIFYLQRLHQYLSPPLQVRDPTTSWHTSSNIVFDHRLHCLTLLQIISPPQELDDLNLQVQSPKFVREAW